MKFWMPRSVLAEQRAIQRQVDYELRRAQMEAAAETYAAQQGIGVSGPGPDHDGHPAPAQQVAAMGTDTYAYVASIGGLRGMPKITTIDELRAESEGIKNGERPPLVGQVPVPPPAQLTSSRSVRDWLAEPDVHWG